MTCLNLRARRCLVVGAGPVGLEKIEGLLAAEADVHVVALHALPEIEQLAREGSLRLDLRAYSDDDLEGAFLVFAATADSDLNVRVFRAAEERTMLVNVVDVPPLCNFIMPAIARVGADLDRRLDARRQPGPRQAAAQRDRRALRRAVRPARRAPQRPPHLGPGHAADLSGPQAFLRGHRARRARSDRAPARGRRAGRARPDRRPHPGRREQRCAGLRAGSRPSSRAWRNARSARRSRMYREADPALEHADGAAAPPRQRDGLPRARAGRSPLLLVGEAMGYAGGRFSGLAFTAERTLAGWGPPYEATSLRPEGWAEQSGTIVHGALDDARARGGALERRARHIRTGRASRSRTARPAWASCAPARTSSPS